MKQNVTERIEEILSGLPLRKRAIILQALLEAAERRVAEQTGTQEEKWRDEVRGELNL